MSNELQAKISTLQTEIEQLESEATQYETAARERRAKRSERKQELGEIVRMVTEARAANAAEAAAKSAKDSQVAAETTLQELSTLKDDLINLMKQVEESRQEAVAAAGELKQLMDGAKQDTTAVKAG